MAYKRAQWRSGLIYQQTCETCKTTIRYTDEKLDFRPWYADGFVYCPNCKTPLRHNEDYAVDQNGNYIKPIEVVKIAGISDNYQTEISKGMRLSEYVALKDDYKSVFN